MNEHPRIAVPEPTSADAEYNRRAWPQFAHALESYGAVAVAIPLRESPAVIAHLASTCCGILLPGSPSDLNPQKYGEEPVPGCAPPDPAREAVDELLLQDAFNLYKPIFGVCYGLQSLNVWRGGSLVQHLNGAGALHDRDGEPHLAHSVTVANGSLLDAATAVRAPGDELTVNSSHHQAVGNPGDGLGIVARSSIDGVIEALEGHNDQHYVLGVQWHPERTFGGDAASRRLFEAFVESSKSWVPRLVSDSVHLSK